MATKKRKARSPEEQLRLSNVRKRETAILERAWNTRWAEPEEIEDLAPLTHAITKAAVLAAIPGKQSSRTAERETEDAIHRGVLAAARKIRGS